MAAVTCEPDVAQILKNLQDVGQSYVDGTGANKAELLSAMATAQRDIEGPAMYLTRTRLLPLNNMCQLMAIEMGLLDAIVHKNGAAVTADELSKEIKQDRSLIARIMRLLLAHGVCEETAPATYRSNAVAQQLVTFEQKSAVRNMVGLMFPIGGHLVPQLRDPKGLHEFADGSTDVTPFRATYGPQSMFDFLETDLELKKAFDGFMTARLQIKRRAWFEIMPIEERVVPGLEHNGDRVVVVDVAGGIGRDIIGFRNRFSVPGRYILQDLPATLENVQPKPEGIELCPHDFFTEQPIKGARIYYLRAVMHNWSDQRCKEILTQIVRAMRKGYSKLLIADMVLADVHEGFHGAAMDMLMFMLMEGKERTRSEFEGLLSAVGLRLVQVWPGDGAESVIEAELM